MPRYFIKLDAPFPVDDKEGEVYLDERHARHDAIGFLADLLKDRCREIKKNEIWTVEVYDEDSTLIYRLGFNAEYPGLEQNVGEERSVACWQTLYN